MTSRDITNAILLGATKLGARLFRQNVGKTWIGDAQRYDKDTTVRVKAGDVVIRQARRFHAGLCTGSSDTIGWIPVTVTEDMVGKRVALFAAVEIKHGTDRLRPEQLAFLEAVNAAGGFAMEARDADLALANIRAVVTKK